MRSLRKTRSRKITAANKRGRHGDRLLSKGKRTIFVAMPFSPEYEDVYHVIAGAADTIGAVCDRVDLAEFSGDIVKEIKSRIRASVAVIADLSEAKPNVLYEIGFAQALRRPTVHICSTPLNELPFDVRNWNTLEYAKGQTHKLRENLVKRLEAVTKQAHRSVTG